MEEQSVGRLEQEAGGEKLVLRCSGSRLHPAKFAGLEMRYWHPVVKCSSSKIVSDLNPAELIVSLQLVYYGGGHIEGMLMLKIQGLA